MYISDEKRLYKLSCVFLPKRFPATISRDVTAASTWFLHAGQGKECCFVTVAFFGYFNNAQYIDDVKE